MDPITGAIISGAVSGGGSIIGTYLQNQANARQQTRSQDYMTEMSNTAHRREVNDLRAAGLNPILSAMKGGASTPNISPAKMENALGSGVTSAVDTIRMTNELKAINSTIGLQQAQGAAAVAGATKDIANAKNAEANTKTTEALLPAIFSESKFRKGQAEWDMKFQELDNYIKRVSGGLDAANSAKQLLPGLNLPKGLKDLSKQPSLRKP